MYTFMQNHWGHCQSVAIKREERLILTWSGSQWWLTKIKWGHRRENMNQLYKKKKKNTKETFTPSKTLNIILITA